MAHVSIEYSNNIGDHHDIALFVSAIHRAASRHAMVGIEALRTRAHACGEFLVATADPSFAFVALHARVGPGRDANTKRSFIQALLDAGESQLNPTPLKIAWSAEITEIDPDFRINRNYVRDAIEQMQGQQ